MNRDRQSNWFEDYAEDTEESQIKERELFILNIMNERTCI